MSKLIIGEIDVVDKTVVTHKDNYLLSNLSAVSVRRPLLVPGCLFGVGMGGTCISFNDLLYPQEIAGFVMIAVAAAITGIKLARLQLLSRDLKNTELSSVVWGEVNALQLERRKIAAAMGNGLRVGEAS